MQAIHDNSRHMNIVVATYLSAADRQAPNISNPENIDIHKIAFIPEGIKVNQKNPSWNYQVVGNYFKDSLLNKLYIAFNPLLYCDSNTLFIWIDEAAGSITISKKIIASLMSGKILSSDYKIENLDKYISSSVEANEEWPGSYSMLLSNYNQVLEETIQLYTKNVLGINLNNYFHRRLTKKCWEIIGKYTRNTSLALSIAIKELSLEDRIYSVNLIEEKHQHHINDLIEGDFKFNEARDSSNNPIFNYENLNDNYPSLIFINEAVDEGLVDTWCGLNACASKHSSNVEGNYFHTHNMKPYSNMPPDPRRAFKRKLFHEITNNSKLMIEIGFNAGHSASIALNNGTSVIAADICKHAYTIPCFEYLSEKYPGKIMLYEGDSRNTLKAIEKDLINNVDLIHIDGGHGLQSATSDIEWAIHNLNRGSTILIDDFYGNNINLAARKYVLEGKIIDISKEITKTTYTEVGVFRLA